MCVNSVSFWLYFSFMTHMDSAGSTAHKNLIKNIIFHKITVLAISF